MTGLQYIGMTMKPGDPHYDLVSRRPKRLFTPDPSDGFDAAFSKPVEYTSTVDLAEMLPSNLERWRRA
jgi:hypothetical protein